MTNGMPADSTPDPEPKPIAGVLVIDKPLGPTSMDCCRRVKAALRRAGFPKTIKVGHGGTLDPLASGVVVVLVGKATRLCDAVMAGTKVYEADVDLAHRSVSSDLETPPEPAPVASTPTQDDVAKGCLAMTGWIEQVPPAHSAVWVEGRRAYALARAGEAVDLKARRVRIDAIELLEYAWPIARLRITCGKGTYIRSLARDLGSALGAGGMLRGLRRTRVGEWDITRAIRLDALPRELTIDMLTPVDVPPRTRGDDAAAN